MSSRRGLVTDPELRFFLALLLNLPDRGAVYAAIRDREPGVDPRQRALEWARRLSGTDVVGVELDELNELLFGCLLDDQTFDGALARVRADYADDEVDAQLDELRAHYADIAASDVFRPLFVAGAASQPRRWVATGLSSGASRPSISEA